MVKVVIGSFPHNRIGVSNRSIDLGVDQNDNCKPRAGKSLLAFTTRKNFQHCFWINTHRKLGKSYKN